MRAVQNVNNLRKSVGQTGKDWAARASHAPSKRDAEAAREEAFDLLASVWEQ